MNYLDSKDAHKFFDTFLSLESYEECKKFLRDLLTEPEIREFSNRWQAVKMLNQKVPYEKITKKTGMSSTTIARIQKWLNGNLGGYKMMLDRMNKQVNTNAHHTPN